MEGHSGMTDWTTLNYVVVDVEGNGQQPPDLVELAAVPIVAGVVGEPSSWLVKPDQPISHFAAGFTASATSRSKTHQCSATSKPTC
jgi:DNA polymerase III epsilon subunit-like protein